MAQDRTNMIPLSNKLLLNPSFAGWNKNTRIQTGLFFASESKEILNNSFYVTYDTYSEKWKGGVGFYLYQGLHGRLNTNETGFGFTYSKTLNKNAGKRVIPSFNINYKLATKQWFAHMIGSSTPPGRNSPRYHLIFPRAGILWVDSDRQIGFSVAYSFHSKISDEGEPPPDNSPEVILYYSKQIDGTQLGLVSKPYELSPEIVIQYSGQIFMTRALLQISDIKHTYGFYIQNNFTNNLHGIGGLYGWNFNRFNLSLSSGSAYNFNGENFSFFGEISLRLKLPYTHFDKNKPWATPKMLF